MGTILVTGGAGYIGSHVARQLGERGEDIVTLDNLSTGFRSAVLYGDLVVGDTGDADLVARLLHERGIDTILHFAAHIVVPESVADPLKYYRNNTANTRSLLQCAVEANVNLRDPDTREGEPPVGGVVMPVLLIGAGAYLSWRRDAGRVEPRSRKEA